MKNFILAITIAFALNTNAQSVAINNDGSTADNSAILDLKSNNQGVLVPRMTAALRTLIGTPATGLMVYQTDAPAGFYFYDGTVWKTINTTSATALPNTFLGRNISNSTTIIFISPFTTNSGTNPGSTTTFYVNNPTIINLTFQSFDDDAINYDLFEVTPVATSGTYSTAGGVLANCATTGWSSGAPTSGSFNYSVSAGKLYSIRITKNGGGSFTNNGTVYSSFSAN